MRLNTRRFGSIEVDADKIIDFPSGIPGFPDIKRYIIITDQDAPPQSYCWLQAIEEGDIALVLIDSFGLMPKYNPLVNQDEIEELGEVDLADIAVFNVAVISDDVETSTVNLKAPIVINERTKKGKQIIVNNDEYEIKHNLVDCINSQGVV